MRIGLVSTVSSPVRREGAGSVEAWTWLLARELRRRGHAVTVFGCAGSEVDGEVEVTLPGPYAVDGAPGDWHVCEWMNLCRAVEASSRFDVLHSQAYLWGLPLEPFSRAPFVHTLHIVPDDSHAALWSARPAAAVTALSGHQWAEHPHLRPAAVIHHGVDTSEFPYQDTPDDYLLYVGRFVSGKGPTHAMRTARTLGIPLVLAGPQNDFYRNVIQPRVDGKLVRYVGYVKGAERSRWMGGARALLYPIQYPEAFGLVLAEAMLCGTPVAAIRLGAVPEIVDEGVTGCMADSMNGFEAAAARTLDLDRAAVRRRAEQRFSAAAMAVRYEAVYQHVAAGL